MKEAILSHLSGDFRRFYEKWIFKVKVSRGQGSGICCLHDDRNPSFSFNLATGFFHCFGCGASGDIFTFYALKHELDVRRDFPAVLQGIAQEFSIPITSKSTYSKSASSSKSAASWESRIVCTYDYPDEDGTLQYQICRLEPKDFRARRPNGKGGWIRDLGDVPLVLYNLSQVNKADEVIVCEGEKDADRLNALGFTATTNPFGAGKWKPEYSESLKGKKVVIPSDNDDAGRKHAEAVARDTYGKATSIKILSLPDLPEKGDMSDFLATFNDPEEAKERLSLLIESAELWTPPKTPTLEDAIFSFSSADSLDIPERKNIIDPWLKEASMTLISGPRGIGKSMLDLGLLKAVSEGTSFGPWKVENPVACLYVDGEMTVSDLKERITYFSNDLREKAPLFFYSDHRANLMGLPRANLLNPEWRCHMKKILTEWGIKLWVLDNLASLAPGIDENKKQDYDPINQFLLELRFAGIASILMHHTGKNPEEQRGTSAREDNVDTSILLKFPSGYVKEEGCKFIMNFKKARVSHRELGAIADHSFQLVEDKGRYSWQWESVRKENKKTVLMMIHNGEDYNLIKVATGLSKSRITQIKQEAQGNGNMSENGRLTPKGWEFINGSNE